MLSTGQQLEAIRTALGRPWSAAGNQDEVSVDTGLTYGQDDLVRILVRRRGRRYDLTDEGRAVALAGRPAGWLDEADPIVSQEGFNVNRRGVLFVTAVEGRDIASLVLRLAEASRAVYLELLEL